MPDESERVPDESVPRESERVPDETAPDETAPGPTAPGEGVRDELQPIGTLAPATLPPGTLRRAPKFGAFIVAGALVGVVLGVLLATVLGSGELTNQGGVLPVLAGANGARAVTAVGLGAVGALVGGALALALDARSRRRTR